MDNAKYFEQARLLIEEHLDRLLPDKTISDIEDAMRYSLMSGGKRLRPLLVLAAADAVNGSGAKYLDVACGLEMIHTYSLIHDDLPAMDDDDYRRGRPTNHTVFGEAKAILAGDGLLTKAFEVMLSQKDVDMGALVETVREIAVCAGAEGMVGGQVIDMHAENNVINIERLKEMHMAKTGALFKAALRAGGRLAGADAKELQALTDYAENFGLAFQITDDILDVVGDSSEMGKSAGSDERRGKCTYVSIYSLDGARALAQQHVEEAVESLSFLGNKAKRLIYLAEKLISRNN